MKSLRFSRFRWALALMAQLTLLPPGAWALCLGSHGHVALEPVASACQASAATERGTRDAACDASDCDDCEDIPLIRGMALRHASLRVDAPAPAPWIGMAPAFALPALSSRNFRLFRPEDPDDPAARSTVVLRC